MTLSITTFSIAIRKCDTKRTQCHSMFMPSVIRLSVVYIGCFKAKCRLCWVLQYSHYAECSSNAECCYAECHYPESHYAECHYAECHYAECHYAECCYAENVFLLNINMLNVALLNIVMLNIVMQKVVMLNVAS